jgi:surface antigen
VLRDVNLFWAGWLAVSSSRPVFSCVAVIFAIAANLMGCARGIPDPGLNVDATIKTSSLTETYGPVVPNPLGLDTETYRDGETIGHAVSAVQFSGKAVPWQNSATGSSGEILSVNEKRLATGALCRDFTALRTSYDGIRNYQGTTCMSDTGFWQLTAFSLR